MKMKYRRFGRTNIPMPVFSCGGMRFQQSWNRSDESTADSDKNVQATVDRALELGLRHIETARGYGTSEKQLGKFLPAYDRSGFIFQTKSGPRDTADQFRADVMDSYDTLGLDYWDLFAIHGINNREKLDRTLNSGSLDAAQKLKEDGVFKYLGFSTHAAPDVIIDAIRTGAFDYVNLHWYWTDQRNAPAIDEARARDMGVFIISPTDKGGRLYDPPEKLKSLCQPLHPIAFNALFCLNRPDVHTLSVGAANPSQFDEILTTLDYLDDPEPVLNPILDKLNAELEKTWGREFLDGWDTGLPEFDAMPGNVNVRVIVRLMIYAKALDMTAFGKMRYNLLGDGGDWFPGMKADAIDAGAIRAALNDAPFRDKIMDILEHAHDFLVGDPVKRLGGDH